MLNHWLLFVVSILVAYTGIAVFGHISGEKSTPLAAFLAALQPVPLLIVTGANMFFALGLFYGFKITRFAIPMTISSGVIVSFLYSAFVLGAKISVYKIAGIVLILGGVALLAV